MESAEDAGIASRHLSEESATAGNPPRWRSSLRIFLLIVGAVAFGLTIGMQASVLAATIIGTTYLIIKRKQPLALTAVVAFIFLTLLGFGTRVEVRLDTGEQRQLLWGLPISYRPIKSQRGTPIVFPIDSAVPKRWVWCATQHGSNNADAMVCDFYFRAATWMDVDPEITKLLVRDIATYVETTHATHGLPDGFSLLFRAADPNMRSRWSKDPGVQDYLSRKGYHRP